MIACYVLLLDNFRYKQTSKVFGLFFSKTGRFMVCISTFGEPKVLHNNQVAQPEFGRFGTELFIYLVLNPNSPQRREKVAEMLWPDKSTVKSRACLNTTLWRMNTFMRDHDFADHLDLVSIGSSKILLKISNNVIVDCVNLQKLLVQADDELGISGILSPTTFSDLQVNVSSISGSFMEGYDRDWILFERERMHCHYIRACSLLMHQFADMRRFERALAYGRRILAHDPLRENIQREVMWLYVMNGQRCEALVHYNRFVSLLKKEMNITPMPETDCLFNLIMSENNDITLAGSSGRTEGAVTAESLIEHYQQYRTSIYQLMRHD